MLNSNGYDLITAGFFSQAGDQRKIQSIDLSEHEFRLRENSYLTINFYRCFIVKYSDLNVDLMPAIYSILSFLQR